MELQKFKKVFASYPELIEERLISRKQACFIAASLFPPVIGKKIMSDYYGILPEYKNTYYESIAHMYCDGFAHYGLDEMIKLAIEQEDLKNESELNALENQSLEC
jgi:hypothetical protein